MKLCSKALDSFGVKCEWVQGEDNSTTENVLLDLLGTRDGSSSQNFAEFTVLWPSVALSRK